MWIKLLNFLFCCILVVLSILFNAHQYTSCVEAVPKHARPLGSWFNSLEQIDFTDNRGVSTTTEHNEIKKLHKKKNKKRRFKKRDKERTTSDELKPKKKRKRNDVRNKFVKTVVRDKDGEYNASSSIENDDRRKPVDIIVHIKMHD